MEAWLFHPGNAPAEHRCMPGLQILAGRRHMCLPWGVQSHTSVRKAEATGCFQIRKEKAPHPFSSSLSSSFSLEVFTLSIIIKLRELNFQGQVMVRWPGNGELRHLEREHNDSPRDYDNLSAQNFRKSSYEGNTAFVTYKIRVYAVSKVSWCHCNGKSKWNGQTVALEAEEYIQSHQK